MGTSVSPCPVASESRYTWRATNRSSDSRCIHADAAVSAVAMNPESSVSKCACTGGAGGQGGRGRDARQVSESEALNGGGRAKGRRDVPPRGRLWESLRRAPRVSRRLGWPRRL